MGDKKDDKYVIAHIAIDDLKDAEHDISHP